MSPLNRGSASSAAEPGRHSAKHELSLYFTNALMDTTYGPLNHKRSLYSQPISALSSDPVHDILWTGNNVGGVVAIYGSRSDSGVVFRIRGDLPVKKIIAGDKYIRAIGSAGTGIGSLSKGILEFTGT